jgi:hypothetical protein
LKKPKASGEKSSPARPHKLTPVWQTHAVLHIFHRVITDYSVFRFGSISAILEWL